MTNPNPNADQLKSIVECIERLEEEKSTIVSDIKEIYLEAKGNGYDTKALRAVIKMRRIAKEDRDEEQAMLDVYLVALGMVS